MRKHFFLQGSCKGREREKVSQTDGPSRLRISPGDDNRSKENVKCSSMKCEDFPFKLTVSLCITIIKRTEEKGTLWVGKPLPSRALGVTGV